MDYTALIGQFLSSVGSSAVSAGLKNMSQDQARDILLRAQNAYGEVDVPTLEQLTADALGPSDLEGYTPDPRYQEAQLRALSRLQELGNGGMSGQDQATLNAAMGKVARTEGAGRNAIRNDMAARGTLGSGAELAMALDNNQNASDRAHQAGLDVAGRAQQRALDAIMSGGNLAGDLRGQDFSEKERIAAAKDAIKKFNATRTSDAYKTRAGIQLQKAGGMAGLAPGVANTYTQQGNNNAALAGGLGTAANTALGAYAQYRNGQKSDADILQEAGQVDSSDYLDRLRKQGP